MSQLIVEPTALAQWQRLVRDATETSEQPTLDESLEAYLVMLLHRFASQRDTGHRVMATEYLEGLLVRGRVRSTRLREVGDHCLILAGLFPHRARRRLVRNSYFIRLGRTAYRQLAEGLGQSTASLYRELSRHFVLLTGILHAIRDLGNEPALDAIEAAELWQDTGSAYARRRLSSSTRGVTVFGPTGPHRH